MARQVQGSSEEQVAERTLAKRLRNARRRKQLTPEQEAELQQFGDAAQFANDAAAGLMQEIRDLGKLPKEVPGVNAEQVHERKLAVRLRLAGGVAVELAS